MLKCTRTHTHTHTPCLFGSWLCVCSTANNDYGSPSLIKIKGGKKEKRNGSKVIKQAADINFQRRAEVFAFPFLLSVPSVLILMASPLSFLCLCSSP